MEIIETVKTFMDEERHISISKEHNNFKISYDTVKDGYEGTFTFNLVIE